MKKQMTKGNNGVNGASKNYWELETPIITETPYAEIHFFKNAGKIQLYSVYETKDGERKLTRACVWDNNDLDGEDALKLLYGFMQALLDCGIENDAFSDAYSIIEEAMEGEETDEEDEDNEETTDEEYTDSDDAIMEHLQTLELADLKKVAKELGAKVVKKDTEETLLDKIEEYEISDIKESLETLGLIKSEDEINEEDENEILLEDLDIDSLKALAKELGMKASKLKKSDKESLLDFLDSKDSETINETMKELGLLESDEEDEEEENSSEFAFVGQNLVYQDGELEKAHKKVKKAHIEFAENAIEWIEYFVESAEEMSAMPTKTPKQKKAQDKVYKEVLENAESWEEEFEEYEDDYKVIRETVKQLVLGKYTKEQALERVLPIIDAYEF